ncbi:PHOSPHATIDATE CYTIDYLYLTRANSFERASE 5 CHLOROPLASTIC [Salix purpurea]|uniref:phosphatidate cytidylyltransferase n=1 Tax=Salix purpurea TaxID=77065 RepID=A0A9Q0SJR6_SALPP|nr:PHOSPHATIDATE CYTIDYLYLTRANSFERASE 5 CHLOROPLASTIC [Salix purpurea]
MASSSFVEIERFHLIPVLSVTCPCHRPLLSKKSLILNRKKLNFDLLLNGSKTAVPVHAKRATEKRWLITSVARAEADSIDEDSGKEEVEKDHISPAKEDSASQLQQKTSQLKKRIIFGLGIGISAGGIVLAGGWVFTVALAAVVFVGAREYFELVRSNGITAGMTPPPRYVSRVCSVICAFMPVLTLYFGQIDISVTFAAFVVAMALLLQRGNPRFSQLSSTMFGLFYCGYLPCFWVKLRCGLAAPALNTRIGTTWPVLLGGQAHWTVGLVATLISMSSIIAADTYAFMGGKAFGRTLLTRISPKKTWEGTFVGLGGCIATSVVLSKFFCWPTSLLSAIAFGFLNFFGSIFGDLTESMIKRDAGVKDSGSLIPGHGNMVLLILLLSDKTPTHFLHTLLMYGTYLTAFCHVPLLFELFR